MIFTLRHLPEKAIEQNQPLFMISVEFSKVFDLVDRETLWKVLKLYGCPEKVVQIIKLFHEGMTGAVRIAGNTGEALRCQERGVLAPTLFSLYLAAVPETMCTNLNSKVFRTKKDGKLFNLAR